MSNIGFFILKHFFQSKQLHCTGLLTISLIEKKNMGKYHVFLPVRTSTIWTAPVI